VVLSKKREKYFQVFRIVKGTESLPEKIIEKLKSVEPYERYFKKIANLSV